MELEEQSELETISRPGWRDYLTAATELALLGFYVLFAALPVVTAGSALATGSWAVHYWVREQAAPPMAAMGRRYLRWILPGAVAEAAVAVAVLLLYFDLKSVGAGLVPGGKLILVATVLLAVWLVSVALLTLIHLGRWAEDGWISALRWAAAVAALTPHWAVVLVLVAALASTIAAFVIPMTPIMLGFGLFALHVVADRLLPEAPEELFQQHPDTGDTLDLG